MVRQGKHPDGRVVLPGRHRCLERICRLPAGGLAFPSRAGPARPAPPRPDLRALSLPLRGGGIRGTGPHPSSPLGLGESEEELKSLLRKVKEESENVGFKLNIQKTKIMASRPITSWQIDGETTESGRDFIWGGSPKALQTPAAAVK